ncbi:hypothetical protein HHI36_012721, partial [Cryptolaemus montrouzieri]
MQNEIDKLKELFDSNNVPVSTTWLMQCVDWCKSEILNANYTFDQLQQEVHNQWLAQDARAIEVPVLPPDLSTKKYMLLNGNYSLQVMQVVDISKPKYWQLQQIRKESALTGPTRNETIESIGTGKRVLQLTLTDGVQYVEAMEYKPIPILNINLTPGIKVRLSGPITIRRGRLMLQEQNIRILGGEVDDLLVSNAAENVLSRALNLPENPNPQIVDVNLLNVNQENEATQNRNDRQESNSVRNPQNILNLNNLQNKASVSNNNYSQTKKPSLDDYPSEEEYAMMIAAEEQLKNQKTMENYCGRENQQTNQNISNLNRFEDPQDEEIEMLMKLERELENKECKKNKKCKTPDLFEDDFDPDQIDHVLEMTNHGDKMKSKNSIKLHDKHQQSTCGSISQRNTNHLPEKNSKKVSSVVDNKSRTNLFDEFINEDDLFGNLDLHTVEETNKSDIISITKLLQSLQRTSNGLFKIKAKFKSIVEKLTLQKDEYKLTIMVEDDSNEMICRIHSDVVSKWAQLTPVEIVNLKKSIFSKDIESKSRVEKALQNIKDRLIEVNHVMDIQVLEKILYHLLQIFII